MDLANEIDAAYPNSKFGSASFTDKFDDNDFVLISDLTDKTNAVKKLAAAFATPDRALDSAPWPASDSALPDAMYEERYGKLRNEPKGALEAIVWASLHATWDDAGLALRYLTQAVAGLCHFDGDNSFDDAWVKSFLPFARSTYPKHNNPFTPTSAPDRGIWTRYASQDFARDVLREKDVHLVVMYAIDENRETPRKGWESLLTALGAAFSQSLFYMPAQLNLVKSGLAGLKAAITSTTISTTVRPTMAPATTVAPTRAPSYTGDWKINWFHLQDHSDAFYGRMQNVIKELTKLANSIDEQYPGSVMGSASYINKNALGESYKNYVRETEDYIIISNLTDKTTALERLSTYFPRTWHPALPAGASAWPEKDSALWEAAYWKLIGKPANEFRGCIEPIIWASQHTNWDAAGSRLLRLLTQASPSLPHYYEDGSAEEKSVRNLGWFVRTTVPAGEKSFWPNRSPQRGIDARYATLQLAKEVIEENSVRLIVLFGTDLGRKTPREGWKTVLGKLGLTADKTLLYLEPNMAGFQQALTIVHMIAPPPPKRTTTTTTTTTTKPTTTTTTTTTKPTSTTTTTTTKPTTTITTTKPTSTVLSTTATKPALSTRVDTLTSLTATTTTTTSTAEVVHSVTGSDIASESGSADEGTTEECDGKGCWNGKGMFLAIDQKPKNLDLKIVA